MTKAEAKTRLLALRTEINHHRYLYHVLDRQEISDAALDSLKHELTKIEKEFPDLVTPDSPSQRVGGKPLSGFRKVVHPVRMLSLDDAFNEEELEEWERRIKRIDPGVHYDYFAEIKVDGFALSLEYEKGVLKTASTRGDGMAGEDVTENVKTVESVPLVLQAGPELAKITEVKKVMHEFPRLKAVALHVPRHIEVRGEIYMTKKAFAQVNAEQKKKGLPLYANPRNIAAGSIRQLDPAMTASRKLEFLAYDVVTDVGQETHEESHQVAKIFGFRTMDLVGRSQKLDQVKEFIRHVAKQRESLPFLIDGVVVQVNSKKTLQRLGVAGKAPRGAIAFKFPAVEATTILKDIIVQVGRTGVLTPVAVLEPVLVGGVTVSRATLHNEDEIKRLGVKIGDTVIIERAGDVIPAVKKVLPNLRPKNARSFRMPQKCPICGSKVVKKTDEVAYRCTNSSCAAVQREKLYHFVSRRALDIRGLGSKIIDILLDQGLIRDAADIFELKEADIAVLERFGEKSAKNIIAAIQGSKKVPLARFIYALGILHVGEETAVDLARYFGTFEKFKEASLDSLVRIGKVGPVAGKSIRDWFDNAMNEKLIAKLKHVGVRIEAERAPRVRQNLAGKIFVLTGGLDSMTRDEAKEKIRERGGDVSGSVSRQTDFVVTGNDAGSKLDRARALGVQTISEAEFLKMIR